MQKIRALVSEIEKLADELCGQREEKIDHLRAKLGETEDQLSCLKRDFNKLSSTLVSLVGDKRIDIKIRNKIVIGVGEEIGVGPKAFYSEMTEEELTEALQVRKDSAKLSRATRKCTRSSRRHSTSFDGAVPCLVTK